MCKSKFQNTLTQEQLDEVQTKLHRVAHGRQRPYLTALEYENARLVCVQGIEVKELTGINGSSNTYTYDGLNKALEGAVQLGLIGQGGE